METLPVLSVCVTLDVIVVESSFFAFFLSFHSLVCPTGNFLNPISSL